LLLIYFSRDGFVIPGRVSGDSERRFLTTASSSSEVTCVRTRWLGLPGATARATSSLFFGVLGDETELAELCTLWMEGGSMDEEGTLGSLRGMNRGAGCFERKLE